MEVLRNQNLSGKKPLFDDEKMFEFLFKAYYPRLTAFAKKFIVDKVEVDDIIQDVFLKVWEKRKEVDEDTFQSYLFTLVRNACINHVKHKKIAHNYRIDIEINTKAEGLYYADFFSDPLHQTIFNEVQNEIEKVIQNLPKQTQNVFRLSRFEGLKNAEIADKLKISIRTVEKHNTKALQKLKTHLTAHYVYAIAVLDLIRELNC